MERVSGFGGVFFRAKDPSALGAWYHTHLGIDPVPTDYDAPCWHQEAGPTVFAPFPAETEYFGDMGNQFMLNFRVRDMEAMIAQLSAAGIEVTQDQQAAPNGRFAWLSDPEGNKIELWEPA